MERVCLEFDASLSNKTPNPKFRGYHGPIDVRQVQHTTKVSKKFTKAIIKATNTPFVLDYNDPLTPIGASSQLQYTQRGFNGKFRVSSATAFLNEKVMTPAGHGVNGRKLRVLFNSTALKTIWSGNTAKGVKFLQNDKHKKAFAKKGVIVCAGLKSSAFLMHSGIGAKELLNSLNITVKSDIPNVGKGLADQSRVTLIYLTNPKDTRKLVFDTNSLFTQIAWLPDPLGDKNKRELRFASINPFPGITIVAFDLCQPKSRGEIIIKSADPLQPPIVNLGVLTNNSDLELYQRGFQIYIKNISAALNTIDNKYQLVFPNPAILDDPELIAAFIKENIASNEHFQSHCRMAPLDQGGVVDSKGRVYGVKNLFVADDSVVPLCMDGSPMASAYLIAANIAKMIINDNK